MKQIPLPIGPDLAQTFENFSSGSNGLTLALMRGLSPSSTHQSVVPSPVYLWGASGAGKTHLLRALVLQWQAHGGQVSWFTAADPAPWVPGESDSLTVLDDCDAFDAEQQQSAFAIFVGAAGRGGQVAAAGRVPPVDLPLRDDLRSRLGWGHVLAVKPLTEAETRATLRKAADRRGIFLSDEVMDYLLTRFARDLKHLMALLDRLDEFALSHKRGVTVPLLKKMLHEEAA